MIISLTSMDCEYRKTGNIFIQFTYCKPTLILVQLTFVKFAKKDKPRKLIAAI